MRSRPLLALCAAALTLGALRPHGATAQDTAPIVVQRDDETAATAVQRAVIAQHARHRALAERFGAQHLDTRVSRATLASLVTSLRGELSARGRIDRAKLREWLRIELADADAQLATLRTTLGAAHIDVRVAQARRTALDEALRGLERDGRYFAELPSP